MNEDHDPKAYCNAEVFARGLANSTTPLPGGWLRYTVPFSAFRCDYDGALPTQVLCWSGGHCTVCGAAIPACGRAGSGAVW